MINKSTLKTMEILEKIADSEKGMTITQLSKELEIPRSSVDDIVKALVMKKYLYCDNEDLKLYQLGNKILEISLKVRGTNEILDIVTPFLKELKEEFNDTIFFGLKDEDDVLYLSKIESSKTVRTTAVLGSRKSLYYTGLGKAILSSYSDEELKDYLNRIKMEPKTKYTITNPEKLFEDIKTTQKRGYAKDYREGDEDVSCVAAPIYQAGKIYGAISIAGLYTAIDNKEIEKRGEKIKSIAEKISKILN